MRNFQFDNSSESVVPKNEGSSADVQDPVNTLNQEICLYFNSAE